MVVSGEGWLLANVNISGYYRVNYDLSNWERLVSLLNNNHKVKTWASPQDSLFGEVVASPTLAREFMSAFSQALPILNRAQIIDDAFNLAR